MVFVSLLTNKLPMKHFAPFALASACLTSPLHAQAPGVTELGFFNLDAGQGSGRFGFDLTADGSRYLGLSSNPVFSDALISALPTDGSFGADFPTEGGIDPDGEFLFAVAGISDSGTVIAGTDYNEFTGRSQPVVFTGASRRALPLGFESGLDEGTAFAISGSSTFVVGEGFRDEFSDDIVAFRWNWRINDVDIIELGNGSETVALGVSGNGEVVVGATSVGIDGFEGRAFRWSSGVGELLSNLPGDAQAFATDVSRSGQVIVGASTPNSENIFDGATAVRWTNSPSPQALFPGLAWAVNGQGNVVVGSRVPTTQQDIAGNRTLNFVPDGTAVRWEEGQGAETIGQWLRRTGAPVPSDISKFTSATDVSSDGDTVLLSSTENPRFDEFGEITGADITTAVARAGDGTLVQDENLVESLFGGFSAQSVARQLAYTTLNGSHHRVLMDTPLDKDGYTTWATGDFARYSELDATQKLGEIGASTNFGLNDLRFGLGVGAGRIDQDLPFSGSSDFTGEFLVGEIDYQIPDTTVILSALAYYGAWEADTTRGYLNAGVLDSSRGETDIDSFALRLRADWKDAFTFGEVRISPRIAYTFTSTNGDAYTETGGGFPVAFDSQRDREHELRAGADFDFAIDERTTFRAGLELVKRFEDESNLSGTIVGLNTFSFPSQDLNSFWGRASAEITHIIGDNQLISASVTGATDGADPNFTGALSYSIQF